MTYAARSLGTFRRLARHFGDGALATIKLPGSLHKPTTGQAVSALAVDGTTAAGSATIDLDAAAVAGTLPKGAQFTIAGDGTTYELTAAVTASSNALANVPITPVLAAEAADDAVVTVTQAYGEATALAWRERFRAGDIDGEAIQSRDWKLCIATATEYEADSVVTFDGRAVSVVEALPHSPGQTQGGLRLHCRG